MRSNTARQFEKNVLEVALSKLRQGEFVLVYDSDNRERETDLIALASAVTPEHVREMRTAGGGLICLFVHHNVTEAFGLPFMTSVYHEAMERYPLLKELEGNDIKYDAKSSFSLAINHRQTFTGITDIDRALTISRFGELAGSVLAGQVADPIASLGAEFRSPGHVPICRSSPNPLQDRFGHTELGCALATMAGAVPVVAGCEMMGDDGRAMSRLKAAAYAKQKGLTLLNGDEIIHAWGHWSA